MRFHRCWFLALAIGIALAPGVAWAQPLGQPDRASPGDAMIQDYLSQESKAIEGRFGNDLASLEDFSRHREEWKQQYWDMLGLWPVPERTPLHAKITGSIEGDGFVVENLHYQSRPGLYVTANLYRPRGESSGTKLPAVLYVCGHSGRGRDGNKTAFQSHGIWFARHGYVCLIVDTLQLGEIAATHHGTYNLERWWWHSRGYTSAGVECWNGVRGIDYLISRDDVDPQRIAVTGISGGGAATFWIAAADERVQVAVPVSGMADLESYVSNRVINGHCDCMFLINTYRWPWTRIASLIAPRPMLFVNSDNDPIFPMDANQRIAARLERVYSLFGAGDRVDALISIGGHDYRQDIRQASYRFVNTHLKRNAAEVTDSEVDLVSGSGTQTVHPLPPEKLRAFPTDADIPADQRNTTIDQSFVAMAERPDGSKDFQFGAWRAERIKRLKELVFGYFPDTIEAANKVPLGEQNPDGTGWLETESPILVPVQYLTKNLESADEVVLLVTTEAVKEIPEELKSPGPNTAVVAMQPRGLDAGRWTKKNPPNYVERSLVLLGRTADTGRVWDVIAVAKHLAETSTPDRSRRMPRKIRVTGRGPASLWSAYAALLDDAIAEVTVVAPPVTHQVAEAPQFLNVLRVADVPELLGMLPRKVLTLVDADKELVERVVALQEAASRTK